MGYSLGTNSVDQKPGIGHAVMAGVMGTVLPYCIAMEPPDDRANPAPRGLEHN
jgi:hypothetical protein